MNWLKKIFYRPKIEVGQKILIISWPRPDGADAYAGTVGVVVDVDCNERAVTYTPFGKQTLKGWLVIKLESGATLCGLGINKLKYKIIK